MGNEARVASWIIFLKPNASFYLVETSIWVLNISKLVNLNEAMNRQRTKGNNKKDGQAATLFIGQQEFSLDHDKTPFKMEFA